jgi:hypothetical protein
MVTSSNNGGTEKCNMKNETADKNKEKIRELELAINHKLLFII